MCLKKHHFKEKMMGTWHTFNNYGYTLDPVPSSVLDILKAEREKYRVGNPMSRDMNTSLAGQINKEHDITYLKDSAEVINFLDGVVSRYINVFKLPIEPVNVKAVETDEWSVELSSLWMNIQERGEYNPIHSHGGVVSFVIWLEIPYSIEEEKALDNSRYSNSPSNGDFYFHPYNTLGKLNSIPMNVGKDKEGTICAFHSELMHSVNPFFTTDKQRVTVSGNFMYKERRNV